MRIMTGSLKSLLVGALLISAGAALADEDAEYTCDEAAEKITSIIDDWHMFVRDAGAEAKNPSVIAMHADHEQGVLVDKFKQQCIANWTANEDIYLCFSGVRSEISAAMCLHPDTNKNDWQYQQ